VARVHAAVARALASASDCSTAAGPPSICVGLSGGVDSIVLLHALHALAGEGRLRLSAVHVHHGLSVNADRWASFCRAGCRRLGVPLSVKKVVVDRQAGLGIEAAARLQRQQVFGALRVDWIALAHHRDDQAETVLLQLLRGSGLRGLSGMPVEGAGRLDVGDTASCAPGHPEGGARGPRILRPLLDLPRALIVDCATRQQLSWIEDESNADTRFDRNFIRHAVLPLLEQRFPAARSSLARSGRLLAQSARLVEAIAMDDLQVALGVGSGGGGVGASPTGVCVAVLSAIGEARGRELLRAWLRAEGVEMPSERRLVEAMRQAVSAGPQRSVEIGFGRLTLRRYRDRLYLVAQSGDEMRGIATARATVQPSGRARAGAGRAAQDSIAWNRRARMALPMLGGTLVAEPATGAGIACRMLRGTSIAIGARVLEAGPAPRIALGDPPMHRTLKNLWQESAVPPWQRDRWPLLRIDGELACIPEVAVAARFAARPGEPGRLFRWLPGG